MITLQADRNPFDDLIDFINRVENPGGGERAKVATAITRGFAENFATEGGASGTPWAPLAPRTVATRGILGFAGEHPILRRTNKYFAAWTQSGAPDHVEVFEKTGAGWSLDVGSEAERTALHERGGITDIPSSQEARGGGFKNVGGARGVFVPARPVGDLGEKAEANIGDVLDFMIAEIGKQTHG